MKILGYALILLIAVWALVSLAPNKPSTTENTGLCSLEELDYIATMTHHLATLSKQLGKEDTTSKQTITSILNLDPSHRFLDPHDFISSIVRDLELAIDGDYQLLEKRYNDWVVITRPDYLISFCEL